MISSGGWIKFDDAELLECDLFVHALGFENRSVELLRRDLVHAQDIISFDFQAPNVLSYDENALVCAKHGTTRVHASQNARATISSYFEARREEAISVVIDISSLNRRLIAELLLEFSILRDQVRNLQIVYTPQRFVEPEAGFSKLGAMGAVVPELTSFDSDPDKPIALMLGLGFEYGVGLGLIDLIEPETTVCFKATGFDPRYELAVKKANFDFEFSTANLIVQPYTLIDPVAAYSGINNIAYGLLANNRIEIVPLGPKLFTAYAILLSLTFLGQITVLRIPSNVNNPRDAFARDGCVFANVGLSVLGDLRSI